MGGLSKIMTKQGELPGMKPAKIKKLQDLGDDWKETMLERVSLGADEAKKKKAIEEYMIENTISEYALDDRRTFIIEKGEKKLKVVKIKTKKSDEPEGDS